MAVWMLFYGQACKSIAQSRNQARQRRQAARERADARREKHKQRIDAEEQAVLDSIQRQLEADNLRQSAICCVECGKPCVTLNVRNVTIDYCPRCRGYWFEPGELKTVADEARDVPSAHLRHREGRFCCPACGRRMTEHVFQAPANLLVDRCPNHHGVYLEAGELKRVFGLH